MPDTNARTAMIEESLENEGSSQEGERYEFPGTCIPNLQARCMGV
jgi:hypothetical protein